MKENDIDARLSRRPIERFQWPLAGALVALSLAMLIGERRRVTASVVMAGSMLLTGTASAKNAGVEAYEQGKFEEAQNEFQRQLKRRPNLPALEFDLGAAAYKRGDYTAALGAFGRAMTSDDPGLRTQAAYNLGNTLVQRGAVQQEKKAKIGEWREAVKKYDEALKLDPKHADAAHNRELILRAIEDLEKEDKDKKDDDQDSKKKEPSEAARKAKKAADEAVLRREYKEALKIMEDQLKIDDTTNYYSDYIKRLQEVNGVQKTDTH